MIKACDWLDQQKQKVTNEERSDQQVTNEERPNPHEVLSSTDTSDASTSSSSDSDSGSDEYENDYNFQKASLESAVVPLQHQPGTKNFYLLNPKNQELVPFSVNSEEASQIYKMAGELLNLALGKYTVKYPIRRINGRRRYVTITLNDKVEVNSTSLYCQTESESTLRVERTSKARVKKRSENLYNKFMRFRVINSASYQLFDQDIYVLEEFVDSLRFSRIWLGHNSCINMLNPAKMVCPVSSCRDVRTLKHFNDFGYVHEHLINHKVKGDAAATKLVDRYSFLIKWFDENKFTPVDEAITTLESTSENWKSLSLAKFNLFRPTIKDNFKGKQNMMDQDAVEKFILGDVNALRHVNAPITSYFVTTASKQNSANNDGNEVGSSGTKRPKINNKLGSSHPTVEKGGVSSSYSKERKRNDERNNDKNDLEISDKKMKKKKKKVEVDGPEASVKSSGKTGVKKSVSGTALSLHRGTTSYPVENLPNKTKKPIEFDRKKISSVPPNKEKKKNKKKTKKDDEPLNRVEKKRDVGTSSSVSQE